MKPKLATLVLSLLLLAGNAQEIRTLGVKINVSDLEKARAFYCDKLRFVVESKDDEYLFLKTGDATRLVLHRVTTLLPEGKNETCGVLSLQVNDLDETISRLRSMGVDFGSEQKRREGVGNAIFVNDPFGKRVSLMHQTSVNVERFTEPKIYNYGFMIPDMGKGIEFYGSTLGFVPLTQKYLPMDMPLGHGDKSFGFMLHFRQGIEAIKHNTTNTEHVVLLFQTVDLETAVAFLKEKGVKVLQKKPQNSPLGKFINFYDPFGYLSEIIEVK